jgi:malate-CoA ligase subunit alpha
MSILIDQNNKIIIQGMLGEKGTFHTKRMIEFGTNVVAGVIPEKGGSDYLDLPIFDTVRDAVEATGADTSIVFASSPFACDSIMEAADASIRLCVCITGRIPQQDMMRVKRYINGFPEPERMHLIGPGCSGIISPGKSLVGVMPEYFYTPGNVGIIARAGTLGFEAAYQLFKADIGISTGVGIGSETITGTTFVQLLEKFNNDDETNAIIMLGEIGGLQEIDAARYYKEHMNKPVISYVAGLAAPKGRRMGHAGAIITAYGESAAEKIEVLKECGVTVVTDPSTFARHIKEVL